MQTYLSDKMLPKKVKLKTKKCDFAKLENSFFNFNFFKGILSLRQYCFFLNQHKISDFLIPYITYFKKTKFNLSEGPILKFINTKTKKDRNTTK